MPKPLNAIILAAGRASRMGVPKVLLPAGRGHTLLSRVLHTALRSVDGQVTVILGREVALCRVEIERSLKGQPQYQARVTTAHNPHYAQGLSTSLRAGVRSVLESGPSEGTIVLLADQPAFSETQARDLIQVFRERRSDTLAVAAAENAQQRNPVIFSVDLLPELLDVGGDKGAREVLKRYETKVETLELGSGPWVVDTDDWPTYAELMRRCDWLEEVGLPTFTGELTEELTEIIEAYLRYEPRPLLAPDVLLVGLEAEFEPLVDLPVRLEQSDFQMLDKQSVQTLILGSSATPQAYLQLLRHAALWTLQR